MEKATFEASPSQSLRWRKLHIFGITQIEMNGKQSLKTESFDQTGRLSMILQVYSVWTVGRHWIVLNRVTSVWKAILVSENLLEAWREGQISAGGGQLKDTVAVFGIRLYLEAWRVTDMGRHRLQSGSYRLRWNLERCILLKDRAWGKEGGASGGMPKTEITFRYCVTLL